VAAVAVVWFVATRVREAIAARDSRHGRGEPELD